jgi:uncharacterized membrane protein
MPARYGGQWILRLILDFAGTPTLTNGHGERDSEGTMGEDHKKMAGRLTRALGMASAGLGLAEIIAPNQISRLCGLRRPGARLILPLLGIRELVHAAGLLPGRQPKQWIWSRVVGDAMDLSLLGRALADRRSDRGRVIAATGAVAAITALDVFAAVQTSRVRRRLHRLHVAGSVTVAQPPERVYRFWRDFENLPTFMDHLESVQTSGKRTSHWVAKAPGGRQVEWDAEVIEDRPQQLIAWRTVDGADVSNSGQVRFVAAPGGRGTEIRVEMDFSPPAGRLGAIVAELFGEHPHQQIRDDLRRFKQVVEAGEVIRSDGSPEGTDTRRTVIQHPAQPANAARL